MSRDAIAWRALGAGLALLVTLLQLVAPGHPTATTPGQPSRAYAQGNAVSIVDFDFQPNALTVSVGTRVTWTNSGTTTHTSTSNFGVWDSGLLNPSQSFGFTFNSTGSFPYFCSIHPFMTGTITVTGAAASTPTPTPTSTPTTPTPNTPTPSTPTPATPTLTTPVPSPTPSACNPRPNVSVAVVPGGAGRLQVTIAANTTAGTPTNQLQALQFGAATNALIDLPGGPTGATGSFNVALPAGTQQAAFTVRPAGSGGAVTVPLVVVDNCGAWPTFVGGGPSAFAAPIPGALPAAAQPGGHPGSILPTPTPAAAARAPALEDPGRLGAAVGRVAPTADAGRIIGRDERALWPPAALPPPPRPPAVPAPPLLPPMPPWWWLAPWPPAPANGVPALPPPDE